MSKGLGIRERQVLQVLAKRQIIVPRLHVFNVRTPAYYFDPKRLNAMKKPPINWLECERSAIRRACESLLRKGILEKSWIVYQGRNYVAYRRKKETIIQL